MAAGAAARQAAERVSGAAQEAASSERRVIMAGSERL